MKSIQRVIREAEPHWVGDGFPVRSLFSYRDGAEFDPFLLLDYAGPYHFAPSEAKRGQKLCVAKLGCFCFEQFNKRSTNNLALLLWIGYSRKTG